MICLRKAHDWMRVSSVRYISLRNVTHLSAEKSTDGQVRTDSLAVMAGLDRSIFNLADMKKQAYYITVYSSV